MDKSSEASYGAYDYSPAVTFYRGTVEDSNGNCGLLIKADGWNASYGKNMYIRAIVTGDFPGTPQLLHTGGSLESNAGSITVN